MTVNCKVCGNTFEHYDHLLDHVQIKHNAVEVYGQLTEGEA